MITVIKNSNETMKMNSKCKCVSNQKLENIHIKKMGCVFES